MRPVTCLWETEHVLRGREHFSLGRRTICPQAPTIPPPLPVHFPQTYTQARSFLSTQPASPPPGHHPSPCKRSWWLTAAALMSTMLGPRQLSWAHSPLDTGLTSGMWVVLPEGCSAHSLTQSVPLSPFPTLITSRQVTHPASECILRSAGSIKFKLRINDL